MRTPFLQQSLGAQHAKPFNFSAPFWGSRGPLKPSVAAGKGFGKPEPQRGGDQKDLQEVLHQVSRNDSKGQGLEVQQTPSEGAARKSRRKAASGAGGARPVDPSEAKRGTLDMVQVKNWGSGQELGELQVSKVSRRMGPGRHAPPVQPAGSGSSATLADLAGAQHMEGSVRGGPTQVCDPLADAGRPPRGEMTFFDILGQEVALAESRGQLKVEGDAPPPLDKWSFKVNRYLQYLTDCLEVHSGLEEALAAAGSSSAAPSNSLGVTQHHPGPEQGSSPASAAAASAQRVLAALACLQQCGLDRSLAIASDVERLGQFHSRQDGAVTASNTAGSSGGGEVSAGSMARSWAQQLQRMGRDVSAGVAALNASPAASQLSAQQEEACGACSQAGARLAAHAYAIHMVHLAGGMRFGAAAAEKLSLFQAGAANFYHKYPASMKDPVSALREATNKAGACLTGSEKEAVIAELPRAVRSASLLMAALAHTD